MSQTGRKMTVLLVSTSKTLCEMTLCYSKCHKHDVKWHLGIQKCEKHYVKLHFWIPRWAVSGFGSRSRQNELQKARFEHFLALAPEVDKMSSRRLDLRHSGLGSRSRQNELKKARFEHFQASVDRMPANNDTFNTWGDRMPAKTRCCWYLCRQDAGK